MKFYAYNQLTSRLTAIFALVFLFFSLSPIYLNNETEHEFNSNNIEVYPIGENINHLTLSHKNNCDDLCFEQRPEDLNYNEGDSGNELVWHVEGDLEDGSYEIWRDEEIVSSGDLRANISLIVDGLEVGNYWYFIIIENDNKTLEDTVRVRVFDDTPPYFNIVSEDFQYIEGSENNTIDWISEDRHPWYYEIYRDDELILEGVWETGHQYSLNVDGLAPEIYEFTIICYDTSGNKAEEKISVAVLSSSTPVFVQIPDDLMFNEDTVNHSLIWEITDDEPKDYEIYRDDVLIKSDSWQSGVPIILGLNHLPVGVYSYAIVVKDQQNNQIIDTVKVQVLDASSPFIESKPENHELLEGEILFLQWLITEDHPDTYRIYINSSLIFEGVWTSAVYINYSYAGLGLGWYNITLIARDIQGNYVSSSVMIGIVDEIKPNIDVNLSILKFPQRSPEENITWILGDLHPSYFAVYHNETQILSNTWLNDEIVSVTTEYLETLEQGFHNFTIIVYDQSGNHASDSVYVLVTVTDSIPTLSPYIEYTANLFEGYLDTIFGIWRSIDDQNIADAVVTASLFNRSASQMKSKISVITLSTSQDGLFSFSAKYDNFLPGIYTWHLHFTRSGFQNQTVVFEVLVLAHEVELALILDEKMVPNENYTITVIATYNDEHNLDKGLQLNEIDQTTGGAEGIVIEIVIDAEFTNGTTQLLNFATKTNSDGIATIILSGHFTKHCKKIHGITANVLSEQHVIESSVIVPQSALPNIVPDNGTAPIEGPNIDINDLVVWSLLIVVCLLTGIYYLTHRQYKHNRLDQDSNSQLSKAHHEIPIFMLIMTKGGSNIFAKELGFTMGDNQLISGFLAAVNSFMGYLFDDTGSIDMIKYQDYTVLIRQNDALLFCYAFKGPTRRVSAKVDNFINRIKARTSTWNRINENLPVISHNDQSHFENCVNDVFIKI
ncbi:MAG: hypothetical protein ACXAD7_00575 [Candidatus Kariarchaeaceae archaeon]